MKKIILNLILALPLIANSSISLENSYLKALEYESKVQSYSYQKMAKQEDIIQAESRLYPKIDLVASGVSKRYKIELGEDDNKEQYLKAKLSLQVPIYHPEYYNDIAQNELKYKYSDIYLTQLKQELAYNVTNAYILIVKAKNALGVADAYLKANKIRYNQIKNMYEKRLANKMDFLSSKVTYEKSKIRMNTEKQNLRLAKFKFKNLTGIVMKDIIQINLENIDVSKLKIKFHKDDLYTKNMEIRKSKININLTKKMIENSKYGHYPKIDLSAQVSKFKYEKEVYDSYDYDANAMLNISIPIYQGGYISSKVAKYKYLLNSSNEDLNDVQRTVISIFEEQLINLQASKENIVLYKEAINSAKLSLHAITRGYENGLKNLIDVEDAKTKLFETKLQLIDSSYEYIKSYTALLNLFGELNQNKLKKLDKILQK